MKREWELWLFQKQTVALKHPESAGDWRDVEQILWQKRAKGGGSVERRPQASVTTPSSWPQIEGDMSTSNPLSQLPSGYKEKEDDQNWADCWTWRQHSRCWRQGTMKRLQVSPYKLQDLQRVSPGPAGHHMTHKRRQKPLWAYEACERMEVEN